MPGPRVKIFNDTARWILLLLLAGLLIGRRDFAHLNLGDIWSALHAVPPGFASRLFVTEAMLLMIFPLALREAWNRFALASGSEWREKFSYAFGWEFCVPLALIGWGALHAVCAAFSGGDTYLIFRQSALAMYPIIFVYAYLFFGANEQQIRLAVWGGVAAALLCAALDAFGCLDPSLDANGLPPYGEWMPIYGQETLPSAILGLIYCAVSASNWTVRGLAMAGVCLAGWRQGVRPMQSVVPIGMAGALALVVSTGILLAIFGRRATLKRVALCIAVFAVMGIGHRVLRAVSAKPEQPGTETSSEVKAWNLSQYSSLFDVFERTQPPADTATWMTARRPPYDKVNDPEVYKLEAVFAATSSVSVRNNMWRFLVWRRMFTDWREGHSIIGAGVGKPWFYRALYQSAFHYGDDREGLDPHNSYLNTLYRYGAIGLALLLGTVLWTVLLAIKALRINDGDPLLEGLLLYFGYTLVFACFTVSFEGPAYSMPFWMTMGLIYSRAQLILSQRRKGAENSA